ncbi:nuclear transport factor 2 family protein [Sphingomonas sp.]|uniref:nuclear transport factor 2 family protein n=1 Tax=Sphingomonas sp. TaxID=28214 RepID=UPI0025FA32F6|nr:nuclear transport factor 2 family protein [Sphingomonas sp.]
MSSNQDVVRGTLQAYVDKDREAIEQLIAEDFHFSSPLDNRIDRDAYFRLCWPSSENMDDFEIVRMASDRDAVFVTYIGTMGGRRFRNTEVHRLRDGKVVEVEVYFGWNVPHDVPAGEHADPKGEPTNG